MIRPLALLALLLPAAALAEPPATPPAELAEAAAGLVGVWTSEAEVQLPEGTGLSVIRLDLRADGTAEATDRIEAPDGAGATVTQVSHMTARWWLERASPTDLRLWLDPETMTDPEGLAREGGEAMVMNLVAQADGSFLDLDRGVTWTR